MTNTQIAIIGASTAATTEAISKLPVQEIATLLLQLIVTVAAIWKIFRKDKSRG